MKIDANHGVLDRVFAVSIVLKGALGALQVIGGALLLFITPEQIRASITWIGTLFFADPTPQVSPLRDWFMHLADRLDVHATVFAAIYLLIHGIVKVLLVWAVWREKLWAYPWMLAALACFIIYQCYEMVVDFSWFMLVLTVFDIFIVVLTVREWQLHKQRARAAQEALAPPSSASSEPADS